MVTLPCGLRLSTEGGMDTAEHPGKGRVSQAPWSDLRARISHACAVRLPGNLPTSETHPSYLEMPVAHDCCDGHEWFMSSASVVPDTALSASSHPSFSQDASWLVC